MQPSDGPSARTTGQQVGHRQHRLGHVDQAARHVETGQLVPLLRDYEPEAVPISVVHRDGRRGSARLRSFIDLIVARLRADRTLNG